MKKILVATDLSKNSKAGIRFAIQLASQNGITLIFYHVMELLKPTSWKNARFESFVDLEMESAQQKVESLVKSVFRQIKKKVRKYECVVEVNAEADKAIIDYATRRKVDFICMSTRGAGVLRRVIGTSTSAVLQHAKSPVFVIPKNYRREAIKHVLYSSDLNSLQKELKTVREFSASINAKTSVLHYDYLQQVREVNEKLEAISKRYRARGVEFHFQKFQIENSLGAHLKTAISKFKPSLVVLFTKQNRDLFDRLFLASKSASVSFDTSKPLLIFSKRPEN